MNAIKLFGTRIAGYSARTPKMRPYRYGEFMCKSPLDKSEQTPAQKSIEKCYRNLKIRIKEFFGLEP